MGSNTVVVIVVAVVLVLLVILVGAFAARSARNRKRRAEADRIREDAREESRRVEKREAIAAETEAKARAAAAEAEAKAAEAARLRDRAAAHRDEATSQREKLDTQWERADSLDPRRKDDADEAFDEAKKIQAQYDEGTPDPKRIDTAPEQPAATEVQHRAVR